MHNIMSCRRGISLFFFFFFEYSHCFANSNYADGEVVALIEKSKVLVEDEDPTHHKTKV